MLLLKLPDPASQCCWRRGLLRVAPFTGPTIFSRLFLVRVPAFPFIMDMLPRMARGGRRAVGVCDQTEWPVVNAMPGHA